MRTPWLIVGLLVGLVLGAIIPPSGYFHNDAERLWAETRPYFWAFYGLFVGLIIDLVRSAKRR
jgi:hypothetical protein